MIRTDILLLSAMLALAVGCGDDSTAAAPDVKTLPVPDVTVSVSDQTATVRWSISEPVEAVRFTFELYAGDAAAPLQSATTRLGSQRFEMETGVSYRFRVLAAAPLGSAEWQDSEFSDFVVFSGDMLGTPAARLVEKSDDSATLSWTAVAGAAEYAYELYEGDDAAPCRAAATIRTTVELTGLSANTAYRFRVKAVAEEEGDDSSYSEPVAFTTDRSSVDPGVDLGLPLADENDGVLRAFPGAEGGGMYTTGGRGGKVYHVTNLNDSGAGSFRAAAEASGKRIVVFDVAGTVHLTSDLRIRNGNLTVAGQTAPGGGVCIAGGTVVIDADNVIIRYMRFRLGDLNTGGNLSDGSDTIWGRYHKDIILDHCSMSWSIDECASFYANQNFTMQWCLLTESLRKSAHGKGDHGYGGIWGGRNASFHHNLLANHDSRNARIDHPGIYGSYLSTHRGNVDYRNNVIYNWGSNTTYGGEDGSFNIVNNYYKPGPASKEKKYFVDAYWYNSSSNVGSAYPRLYMSGNYHAGSYASSINGDQWSGVYYHPQGNDPSTTDGRLSAPLSIKAGDATVCHTTTHTAAGAFDAVLSYAGASLCRDAVDKRAETDARSGKATWFGVISDINGDSISPFCQVPDRKRGDALMDINPGVFTKRLDNGTGPTFMNCTGYSEEDHAYQHKQFLCEGIDSITDYLDKRGIDLHKSMVEFGTYDYSLSQRGIDIGLDASTNVPGIYAAGICCGNVRGNITSASVWGDVAGESVAEYVKTVDDYDVSGDPAIQEHIDFYNALMNRPEGADWLEANSSLQVIMNDYVGLKLRSEDMMRAGIKYLDDLKAYAKSDIGCEDAHQLMRTMELFDLIDLAKAVAITSRNRKESRGNHKRIDYDYTNPLLTGMFQTIHLDKDGEPVLEWRKRVTKEQ